MIEILKRRAKNNSTTARTNEEGRRAATVMKRGRERHEHLNHGN